MLLLVLLRGGVEPVLLGRACGSGGFRLLLGPAEQGVPQLSDVEVLWWWVAAGFWSACAAVCWSAGWKPSLTLGLGS